jgi:hypothetical protein
MEKDMKKYLVLAALLATVSTCAWAQEPDPYAAGQSALASQKMQERIDDLLADARSVYIAASCGVVEDKMAEIAVHREATALVGETMDEWPITRVPYINYQDLKQKLVDVKSKAVANASAHCDYWKEHPEAVRAVREFVRF